MGIKTSVNLKTASGQSTVEYILLLVVVISLATTVFKSDAYNRLFGDEGKFTSVFRRELEYSYMHGLSGKTGFRVPGYGGGNHDSYNDRFFGSKDPYP